jgi:23S rRNA pseudouridine2605 synthase
VTDAAGEKLHKVLADLGYGSRRTMERWIEAGRVRVNGERATLGQRVTGADKVEVDGRRVAAKTAQYSRVLLLNKSSGVVCTRRDPEGRPTVFEGLPVLKRGRWVSVGRLDVQTSGLLLMTNDGALAHRLMHPSTGLDREYAVRVQGRLDDEALERLRRGVEIDGALHRFTDIRYYDGSGHNHWYHVVLMEGRNREVRRLFEAVDVPVSRLKRVRYGPVVLPSWLRRGACHELSADDVRALYRLLKLGKPQLPPLRRGSPKRGADRSVLLPYPELPAPAKAQP